MSAAPWQTEAQAITRGLTHGCTWHGRPLSPACCECGMIEWYRKNPAEAIMRGVDPGHLDTLTRAECLSPGDIIVHDPWGERIDVTVLRWAVWEPDRFGRYMMRFWARRTDTGEEGFMTYGPGGIAHTRQED